MTDVQTTSPADAVAAVTDAAAEGARDPDGTGYRLKQALASFHDIDPARITLGNGSNDLLCLLGQILLGPGTNIVMARHAFAIYALVALGMNAGVRWAEARTASCGRDSPMFCRNTRLQAPPAKTTALQPSRPRSLTTPVTRPPSRSSVRTAVPSRITAPARRAARAIAGTAVAGSAWLSLGVCRAPR